MKMARVLFLALLALPMFTTLAADAPAPKPTEAQIVQWVKDLGADKFETREKAEKLLISAGAPALAPVTAAIKGGDAEVVLRGQRVLDELQWAVRPDITDFAALAPADAFVLLQAPSVKGLADIARKQTAAGKLYDSPEAAPIKKAVAGFVIENARMTDAAQNTVATWVDVYGGPFGFAVLSTVGPDVNVTLLGVNAEDKIKAHAAFLERFPMGWGNAKIEQERYRGINISYPAPHTYDACALVKNVILRGSKPQAIRPLIDAVADEKKDRMSASPLYLQGLQKIGSAPLLSFFFNMKELKKQLLEKSNHDMQQFMAMGFDTLKYGMIGLHVKDDLFEERLFAKLDGERKGLAKLLSLANTTGAQAALCPPDALAFVTLPLKGREMFEQIIAMVLEESRMPREQFDAQMAPVEGLLGAKIPELLAGVDGEAALWVSRPAGEAIAPPDLTAVLSMKDAAAAAKLSDAVTKLIQNLVKEDGRSAADYKGRKLQWLLRKNIGRDCPYDLCWCVDGARVLLGSSPEVVQRLLNRIDSKAPGLDSAADYKRLQALLKPDERGGMVYINTAETFGWLHTFGVPALVQMLPEDKRGAFANLPKDGAAFFKSLPGMLLSLSGAPDGVQAVSYGGMPTIGLLVTSGFSTLFAVKFAVQPGGRAARPAFIEVEEVKF
jgi:hypothetical protein